MHMQSNLEEAVAWFTASRRIIVDRVPTIYAAHLTLQPEALEIQDLCIISFLILEQKSRLLSRRTRE
jgi:hypothetical protein